MSAQKDIVDLLLMAKKAERHSLMFLFDAASLVRSIRLVVHVLQLERGASTLYLVSSGAGDDAARLKGFRREFAALQDGLLASVHDWPEQKNEGVALGGAVYVRLAQVLSVMAGLDDVRAKVDNLSIQPQQEIAYFNELIRSLLAVILDMADLSMDGEVSKAMVSLFNFMQAKEYAGQERAWRVFCFARACPDSAVIEVLQRCVDEQDAFFDVFMSFGEATQIEKLRQQLQHQKAFERYRGVALTQARGLAFAQDWFDESTRRMEVLHKIESELIDVLLCLCAQKLQKAEQALNCEQELVDIFKVRAKGVVDGSERLDPMNDAARGRVLRAADVLMEKVQAQAKHVQTLQEQLVLAKQALLERKFIERAKSLLILKQGITEEEAHKVLQEAAMRSGMKVVEVAKKILKTK